MKTTISLMTIIVGIVLCYGCSSSHSVSSEDMSFMKSKCEYLLKIDSAHCTPDLVRLFGIEDCYKIAYWNQKYRNYKLMLDSFAVHTNVPRIFVNGKYELDKPRTTYSYLLIYRMYDNDKRLKLNIAFFFKRDEFTKSLYCDHIAKNYWKRYIYHDPSFYPKEDEDDEVP